MRLLQRILQAAEDPPGHRVAQRLWCFTSYPRPSPRWDSQGLGRRRRPAVFSDVTLPTSFGWQPLNPALASVWRWPSPRPKAKREKGGEWSQVCILLLLVFIRGMETRYRKGNGYQVNINYFCEVGMHPPLLCSIHKACAENDKQDGCVLFKGQAAL